MLFLALPSLALRRLQSTLQHLQGDEIARCTSMIDFMRLRALSGLHLRLPGRLQVTCHHPPAHPTSPFSRAFLQLRSQPQMSKSSQMLSGEP
jgi:hypothetical protein